MERKGGIIADVEGSHSRQEKKSEVVALEREGIGQRISERVQRQERAASGARKCRRELVEKRTFLFLFSVDRENKNRLPTHFLPDQILPMCGRLK